MHKFAWDNGILVRYFARGERKEEIARPFIQAAAAKGNSAVALIGARALPADPLAAEGSTGDDRQRYRDPVPGQ